MTKKRNKKTRKTKKLKVKNKKNYRGGLQSVEQGKYGTCYSESVSRIILKILKHPEIKLIPDINDLNPEILNKLNEFETLYIKNKKEFKFANPSFQSSDSKFLELQNLPINKTVLEDRIKFVNENESLKTTLETQTKYYNLFNNFFISNCGVDGANEISIMRWFQNYLNKLVDNNNITLETIIEYLHLFSFKTPIIL